MSLSASLREHIPALAMYLFKRIGPLSSLHCKDKILGLRSLPRPSLRRWSTISDKISDSAVAFRFRVLTGRPLSSLRL